MVTRKQIAVVFNKYGARIIVNPGNAYKNAKDVVLNPDLSLVKGVPPHYWKLEDGKIVPKNKLERLLVDRLHETAPFESLKVQVFKKSPSKLYALLFIALGATISEIIRLVIIHLPK